MTAPAGTEPLDEASLEAASELAPAAEPSRAAKAEVANAPLWLPAHDVLVVEQSVARPPDTVDGYGLIDRLKALFLGSRWKMAANGATTLAVLLFLVSIPGLELGVGGLIKIAIYQSWTLGLMLLATRRVRSISVWTLTRYWLTGMFLVTTLVHFLSGPASALAERADVFAYPVLEELLKAAPLGLAALVGRKVWRHPGLSDFMVLGFAVGGGYGFHAAGLRGQTSASGFDPDFGFLVPSSLRAEGLLIVGHAVSAALIGLALGLLVLHLHQAVAAVAAGTLITVTVLDRMASADGQGTLNWVRSITFGGDLMGLLFVTGLVAAVVVDRRRLAATGERDHLFPSDVTRVGSLGTDDGDLLAGTRVGRYRRLRNGVHTTIDSVGQQWPPHSEAHPAPLSELARLARSAAIGVGPGSSPSGWAPDPDEIGRFRFAGPYGFTAYGAGLDSGPMGPASTVAERNNPDLDDETRAALRREAELAEERARRAGPAGPTTATLSVERANENASALAVRTLARDYWQYVGLALVAVALFIGVRLLTAGDLAENLVAVPLQLPEAVASPGLVIGLLASLATAVGISGRNQPVLGAGWDVGPGDDPRPVRPRECEV